MAEESLKIVNPTMRLAWELAKSKFTSTIETDSQIALSAISPIILNEVEIGESFVFSSRMYERYTRLQDNEGNDYIIGNSALSSRIYLYKNSDIRTSINFRENIRSFFNHSTDSFNQSIEKMDRIDIFDPKHYID